MRLRYKYLYASEHEACRITPDYRRSFSRLHDKHIRKDSSCLSSSTISGVDSI